MNLFGVGPTEIFVVLIVVLVLFGPERLPEIAKKIGNASRDLRGNLDSLNEQMNSALETSMELDKARMIKPVDQPAETATGATETPVPPGAVVDGSLAESSLVSPAETAAAAPAEPASISPTVVPADHTPPELAPLPTEPLPKPKPPTV